MLCCSYERKFMHACTSRALLVPSRFEHAHCASEVHGA